MQCLTIAGVALRIYHRPNTVQCINYRSVEENNVLGCILHTVLGRVQRLSFMFLIEPHLAPRHSYVTILNGNTVIVRTCNQTGFEDVVKELRIAYEIPQDTTYQFVMDTSMEHSAEKEEDIFKRYGDM